MVRWALRQGLRKGLLGGSRAWLVVGTGALAVRLLQKLAGNDEEVVLREELPVGAAVVIANEPR